MGRCQSLYTGEEVLAAIFADSGSECADSDSDWDGDDDENKENEIILESEGFISEDQQTFRPTPSDFQNREGWCKLDSERDVIQPHSFHVDFDKVPGIRDGVVFDEDNPIDYFYKFFPKSIFECMAEETNHYASQYFDSTVDLPPHSRYLKWQETSTEEMKSFVALEIAMGLCEKPSLQSYWDEWWLTQTSNFKNVMSCNRFHLLRSFLHFNDNSRHVPKGQYGYDILFKVRPIIDLVKDTYLEVYQPRMNLAIDETMRKFKGRLSFRQYMPNKPNKWGIKIWSLCDAVNGFNLRWNIYCGKQAEQSENLGLGFSVVNELLHGLNNCGYRVFMDNFFSSPKLFAHLKDLDIGACGTIRCCRKGLPPDVTAVKLKKGEKPVFWSKHDMVLTTWQDTACVTALSTCHDSSVVDKQVKLKVGEGFRTLKKPALVDDYNMNMNGVDRFDQYCSYYNFPHKSQKWYQVVYHFIKEAALVMPIYCIMSGSLKWKWIK